MQGGGYSRRAGLTYRRLVQTKLARSGEVDSGASTLASELQHLLLEARDELVRVSADREEAEARATRAEAEAARLRKLLSPQQAADPTAPAGTRRPRGSTSSFTEAMAMAAAALGEVAGVAGVATSSLQHPRGASGEDIWNVPGDSQSPVSPPAPPPRV